MRAMLRAGSFLGAVWVVSGAATGVMAGCASLAGLTGGDGEPGDAGPPQSALDAASDVTRHLDAPAPDARPEAAPKDARPDVAVPVEATSCTMCGGSACVDLLTSATNCGACGVACKACTSGYCLDYMDTGNMYAAGPDGGPTPSQGIASLSYLAPLVYWAGFAPPGDEQADNVLIGNRPSAATLPDPYEEQVYLSLSKAPIALTNDGQSIFLGGAGYLAMFTPPSPLVVSVDSGHAELSSGIVLLDAGTVMTANLIAADGVNVYWTDSTASTVMQLDKAGGAPLTLAPDQFTPTGLTFDATNVYWIASRTIWSIPIGSVNGVPVTVASATSATTDASLPTPILQQGGFLYWGDPGAGTIFSIPTGGGTAQAFATHQPNITELATDGTSLYWTTSTTTGASVVMQPLAGTTPTTIGSFPEKGAQVNGGLALDTDGGQTTVFGAVVLPETPAITVLVKLTPPPG